MTDTLLAETLEAAQADYRQRSVQHARDCVCLAAVTSAPMAAELLDKALEYWAVCAPDR